MYRSGYLGGVDGKQSHRAGSGDKHFAAATLVGKLVRVLVVQVPEGGQRRKNMGTRSLKGVWLWICNTTGVEGSELGVGRRKV